MYYLSILVTLQNIFYLSNSNQNSFLVNGLRKRLANGFYSNYQDFNATVIADWDHEKCHCIPWNQCDKYFKVITTKTCTNSHEICCPLSDEIDTIDNFSCGDSKISYIDLITPRSQIYSGIQPGEYPWMTAILQKSFYQDQSYIFLCGGSIIHPRIVLTATHCLKLLEAIDLKVRAGITKLYEYQDTVQERNVIQIIKHPSYFSGGLFNDISLLILDIPFVINQAIDIICLPNNEIQFKKSNCLATGWGSNSASDHKITNSMNKVLLDIVPKKKCERQLMNYLSQNFKLHDSFLCAIGKYGQDTCTGDGGGPLICSISNSSKWYQVGIVSWGISCGVPYIPGVYTDVSNFIEWINKQLKRN